MLIAVAGTLKAGKNTIADYLVDRHGFTRCSVTASTLDLTALDLSSPTLSFASHAALLIHATAHWQANLVTTDVKTVATLELYRKRPFFLLVGVDAPVCTRHGRQAQSLERFIAASDDALYADGLAHLLYAANVRVFNTYSSIDTLFAHLDALNLAHGDRIRPSWDTYFMQLASLAAMRSNCMKRRVGCVLVRHHRVLATGYNGTPRGITNCNAGGCRRCNAGTVGGQSLGTCLCLHAEENALLEAGRDRIGNDAVLYCNTCPCLTCSVKIAQVGVKEVVFHQAYSMDTESARILKEAGVILRQFSPPEQAF